MSEYSLKEVLVCPSQLLLDPRNPRIIESPEKYICSEDTDYRKDWVQEKTLECITKGKFNVAKLEASILNDGFLNIDSIFVKEYGDNHYLVLEGNRRTAALKNIISAGETPAIRPNSIERVPVKILEVEDSSREDEIITRILAKRHLDGPLEWEPMQRAFVVYQTYEKIFESTFPETPIKYDRGVTEVLSKQVNLEPKDIYSQLCAVRIFQQLLELDKPVTSSHFSIITKTAGYRKLRRDIFGFNSSKMQFSHEGCLKFSSLCLEDGRPINDPKKVLLLHKFNYEERPDLIDLLESRSIDLDDAEEKMKFSASKHKFLDSLKVVDKAIDSIIPAEYQGSAEEKLLFQTIQEKVNEKLARICK